MQVHSDASNLKDVFDAGIHKLGLEFSIDKDTAANYAHEVMRKRRRSDDSVQVSAPARQTPVAPMPTSVTSPSQVVAIGYRDSAGNGLFKMANSDDQLFPVRIADSIPISGTVTVGASSVTFNSNVAKRDDGSWTNLGVETGSGYVKARVYPSDVAPFTATVTVGNSVTIGSLPTLAPQLPRVTFIDGSGSVTTANSAITVFAASTTRSYLLVQVTTGSAFVNVGATATTVNGINLTAGQGYAWETTIPQGLVSLISTTTSSRWVAKEA
jgi:hypothetical protein